MNIIFNELRQEILLGHSGLSSSESSMTQLPSYCMIDQQ